jgi:delta 1-pyrroline-5-carboxylate dehydrogenase
MIGAVVGVQPFGGEGLSGTGPKAGGPRYLHRFATERTVAFLNGGSPFDMDVALGFVHFLFIRHSIAQLAQAAGDGDGDGRDFSPLPIIAPSY